MQINFRAGSIRRLKFSRRMNVALMAVGLLILLFVIPTAAFQGTPTFSDGFEDGTFGAWGGVAGDGDLWVTTASALVGTYGMQVDIDDNIPNYVIDSSPSAGQAQYRARFHFDPNSIPMATGNIHYIFAAVDGARRPVLIWLRRAANKYNLLARTQRDSGHYVNTTSVSITDAPHYIEVSWSASSADGANDGSFTWWVDGVARGTISNLDNDTLRVREAWMGAVEGVDSGTRGTTYFDAYAWTTGTPIGAEPTATMTPTSTHTFTSTPGMKTPTQTPTRTPSRTPTRTMSPTPSRTFSATPTRTPTLTPSYTPTATETPSDTPTETSSPVPSLTSTAQCEVSPVGVSPVFFMTLDTVRFDLTNQHASEPVHIFGFELFWVEHMSQMSVIQVWGGGFAPGAENSVQMWVGPDESPNTSSGASWIGITPNEGTWLAPLTIAAGETESVYFLFSGGAGNTVAEDFGSIPEDFAQTWFVIDSAGCGATYTPVPSVTLTPTDTWTMTSTPTITNTPTASFTPSPSRTPSQSPTPSITPSWSWTPSMSPTRTPTRTPSRTPTRTVSRTPTRTPLPSPTSSG